MPFICSVRATSALSKFNTVGGGKSDQYWSASEPVVVGNSNQYCFASWPVLVRAWTTTGRNALLYWYAQVAYNRGSLRCDGAGSSLALVGISQRRKV